MYDYHVPTIITNGRYAAMVVIPVVAHTPNRAKTTARITALLTLAQEGHKTASSRDSSLNTTETLPSTETRHKPVLPPYEAKDAT